VSLKAATLAYLVWFSLLDVQLNNRVMFCAEEFCGVTKQVNVLFNWLSVVDMLMLSIDGVVAGGKLEVILLAPSQPYTEQAYTLQLTTSLFDQLSPHVSFVWVLLVVAMVENLVWLRLVDVQLKYMVTFNAEEFCGVAKQANAVLSSWSVADRLIPSIAGSD
jgi:hypothetical protein